MHKSESSNNLRQKNKMKINLIIENEYTLENQDHPQPEPIGRVQSQALLSKYETKNLELASAQSSMKIPEIKSREIKSDNCKQPHNWQMYEPSDIDRREEERAKEELQRSQENTD
jgi:hypothetical protein